MHTSGGAPVSWELAMYPKSVLNKYKMVIVNPDNPNSYDLTTYNTPVYIRSSDWFRSVHGVDAYFAVSSDDNYSSLKVSKERGPDSKWLIVDPDEPESEEIVQFNKKLLLKSVTGKNCIFINDSDSLKPGMVSEDKAKSDANGKWSFSIPPPVSD